MVPPKFEVGEISVPTPTWEPQDGQPKVDLKFEFLTGGQPNFTKIEALESKIKVQNK